MHVLVTFAVEAEFAPWRKRHKFQVHEHCVTGSDTVQKSYHSTISVSSVAVFLTGIGWSNFGSDAAKYGLRALLAERPAVCISTGLAGGLKEKFESGDVVVANCVSTGADHPHIRSDAALVAAAETCGAKVADRLITWSHVVSEAKTKGAMGLFGDVVDMESFHVMTTASGAKVPSVAVRSVSDAANEDLPVDFSKVVDRTGRLKKQRLLLELARRPERIPALVRFSKRSVSATVALADFLDRYILELELSFGKKPSANAERAATQ